MSYRRTALAVAFLALLGLAAAGAAPAKPKPPAGKVTANELKILLRRRMRAEDILETCRKRGLEMPWKAGTNALFRQARFTPLQMAAMKRLAEAAKPAEPEPAQQEAPGAKCGPRKPAAWQESERDRVKRIIQRTGLDLFPHDCGTVTLVCSKRWQQKLVPFTTKTAKMVQDRVPGTFAKGLDRRSAHIVVVDNDYDYKLWTKSMVAVLKEDGFVFQDRRGHDPADFLCDAPGYVMPTLCCTNAKAAGGQGGVNRYVSYNVGHLYMHQLSEGKAPKTLETGFGNLVEEWAVGYPSMILYSYAPPEMKRAGAWAAVVRKRLMGGALNRPDVVFSFTTEDMKPPQYAEAWSLTASLAGVPWEFDQLAQSLRDGSEVMQAIQSIYGVTPEEFLAAWKLAIIRKR